MPQPTILTYNELDGEEVKHILEKRFHQILDEVPYFQRHLTLARIKMTQTVKIEILADQPSPHKLEFGDKVEVKMEPEVFEAATVDSTAPGIGHPPDQIREKYGLD